MAFLRQCLLELRLKRSEAADWGLEPDAVRDPSRDEDMRSVEPRRCDPPYVEDHRGPRAIA